MHIVVLGCEPIGVELALALEREGHSVAIIDRDPAALARLGPVFQGKRVAGYGFDRDVLVQAGVEHAGAFAALTADDKANALAAYVARTTFHVPRVVARLVEARQLETYEHLDIATIAPAQWGAQRALELLTLPDHATPLSFGNGEVEIVQSVIPIEAAGQAASSLGRPGEIALVAVVRGGHAFVPTAGARLEAGDVVYLSVAAGAQGRLKELLS